MLPMTRRLPLALPCLLAALLFAGAALGQDPAGLSAAQEKAAKGRQEVRRLGEEERRIRQALSGVEARVAVLEQRLAVQEGRLSAVRDQERRAREEHFALERQREATLAELTGLLNALWPVHVQSLPDRLGEARTWEAADRRVTWLAQIYAATRQKLELAQEQARRMAENLKDQRRLELEARGQLERINELKDDLLADRLALLANLKRVRSIRQSREEELQDILKTIEEMRYELASHQTKRFVGYKNALPWPARGRVLFEFAPEATPPRHGLALAVAEGSTVRAVFWGKVVHSDTLRGFGRVVIVYHGYNYYSLYAFLAETLVRAGQEVEKDEPVGRAGYYPEAKGPGLYFELRFRQKPINPNQWLATLQ
jgi:septal ring factor EnvC (AmiA/AmiB activator)